MKRNKNQRRNNNCRRSGSDFGGLFMKRLLTAVCLLIASRFAPDSLPQKAGRRRKNCPTNSAPFRRDFNPSRNPNPGPVNRCGTEHRTQHSADYLRKYRPRFRNRLPGFHQQLRIQIQKHRYWPAQNRRHPRFLRLHHSNAR